MALFIGSFALKAWYADFKRERKDFDAFMPSTLPGYDTYWHPSFPDEWDVYDRFATPDELYTIKLSHSYWDLKNGSWQKHMEDAMFLKSKGAELDLELHDLLYKVWEEKHGSKKVNLQMTAEDFFTDAVVRIYDHDSIHAAVAYNDRPLYEKTLVGGQEIKVDMSIIKAMPFEEKVLMYREEVYATALERILIPKDLNTSPRAAYAWALRRTITSLTRGWSARFMAENYDVFRAPDCDYVQRFKNNAHRLIKL